MKTIMLIAFISYSIIGYSQLSPQEKITEVYGSQFFSENQTGYDFFLRIIEERVSFREEPYTANDKYPKISSVGFINKINPEIVPFSSENFTQESFNPLRYELDFYQSKRTMVYRIDNTNYILIIQPQ